MKLKVMERTRTYIVIMQAVTIEFLRLMVSNLDLNYHLQMMKAQI